MRIIKRGKQKVFNNPKPKERNYTFVLTIDET
jgi:hypothetical protein